MREYYISSTFKYMCQVLQLAMQLLCFSWISDGMLSNGRMLSDNGMMLSDITSKLASAITQCVYSCLVCSWQLVFVCS